jgi:hypothetical protein
MNPVDHSELYDAIILGDRISPGTVVITGHDRKDKWTIASAAKQRGATTDLNGDDPIEFNCRFFLATIGQLEEWPEFRKVIDATVNGNGGKPAPQDIYHPDLEENGIRSVCRAMIGGRENDGKGGSYFNVKFIEYRPKKASGGTAKGSSQSTKRPGQEKAADPNAAAQEELERLLRQWEDVPGGKELRAKER